MFPIEWGVASCDATPHPRAVFEPGERGDFGQGHVLVFLSLEDAATIHRASITHVAIAKQIFARLLKYCYLLGGRAGDCEPAQQAHRDKRNSNHVTQFRHLSSPLVSKGRLIPPSAMVRWCLLFQANLLPFQARDHLVARHRFLYNQFDDQARCALRPGNVHSARWLARRLFGGLICRRRHRRFASVCRIAAGFIVSVCIFDNVRLS